MNLREFLSSSDNFVLAQNEIRNLLIDDDYDFVKSLLQDYLDSNRDALKELIISWFQQDWEKLKFWSHRLAGSSRIIGASKIAEASSLIEKSIKEGNYAVGKIIDTVIDEHKKVDSFIMQIVCCP